MLSSDQKHFVKQYIHIRSKTKKIAPLMIGIVIVASMSNYLLSYTTPHHNNDNNKAIQMGIIENAIDNFQHQSAIPYTQIIIKQGPIYTSGDSLQSYNNLIKVQGFVVPKNSTILALSTIKPLEDFMQKPYSIDVLRMQIQALLNGSQTITPISKHSNIPLTDSLIKQFDLDCLRQTVNSPLCNQNTEKFINQFVLFALEGAIEELKLIMEHINNKRQKRILCEKILLYTQYNQLFHPSIQTTLQGCEQSIQNTYKNMWDLYTINTEFNNNIYNQTIYQNQDLNIYKMMSLAQHIMQDIQNDTINSRRIQGYSNYIQALLRNPSIESIYRDMQYWIINYQIIPYLQQNSTRNPQYNQIINQLLGLNRDNTLLQYSGLQSMINNQDLIQQKEALYGGTNENIATNIIQGLISLPYIDINRTYTSGSTIYLQGHITITDAFGSSDRSPFQATGEINLNRLVINNIVLDTYPLFTTILNTFIQNRNTTLPGLYSYINENISLYRPQANQEICEQLTTITTFQIQICNTSLIQGTQKTYDTNILYKIHIDNYSINNIETSDETLTAYLQQNYANTISDPIRMPSLIKEILLMQTQTEQNSDTKKQDTNIIQIANTFNVFFKTRAIEIGMLQGIYYIEFISNGIPFVLAYDQQTNTSGPLFFKDVTINTRPLRVQKRSIKRDPENTHIINRFMANPLEYIQEIDPFVYQSYLQVKQ